MPLGTKELNVKCLTIQ